ncbi:hypothetical protein B0F90DRAFT_1927674 [Multifurca ochricompacta]|uniref:Novel STAND NTPase 1 domain-containing protein n=1 Tax=Multifurca ochricompacta TaxID=376703 RepID=A0AAD4LYJ6_9AGAM|nr:hypothetical protein B0F90DRAFT_1927674 [Multifurca ochricompacta]
MITSNSSRILGILRRSPRPTEAAAKMLLDLELPATVDILQPGKPDSRLGAFEASMAVLKEAASMTVNIPYLGAVAGIFLQIIRIKGEVDLYRDLWEEVMYNVVKVVDLVKHFSALCQRHGLCDEETFPQSFVGIIKELESEFVRVVEVLSQCRGKNKFEQFKKGLGRNDMIKEIQKCDRQMNRMFERFMAALVVDIRFQQLFPASGPMPAPRPTPASLPMSIPSVTIEEPPLALPYLLPFTQPQISEPLTRPSSNVRSISSTSISVSVLPSPRPVRPQVFFGRDAELKGVVNTICSSASPARVAILGPGGAGKTALAHAVLTHDQVISRFGDSRYLIPCESIQSRDALLVAIANSLALLQPGTASDSYPVGLESRVLSAMGSEECILCLDDFESPWDQPGPSRKAVELLLADITGLSSVTVLITMRGGERPKETAWTLPMLPPLTNFGRDAAKRTWESLAGTCDEWAEKLIDAVDCLPLAVTLLGSLAEVSTAEMLWERWQKENIAVVEKEKGDKLSSLEFSIALSLESGRMAADPSSRRLLGILSQLPDGMPAYPPPEFRRLFPNIPDISRSLDTLLKCSLAVRTADKRVQVNSLVQFYCEKHGLAVSEDKEALRDYYATLASHGYDNLSQDLFKRMTMEMNNMESVLQKSLTWTPLPEITPIVEAIVAYTQFCSYIGNFSDVVITQATQAQGLSEETLGDCLTSLGSVCLSDDKVDLAQEHFERALTLHQNAQDIIGQANDHCHLGDVLYRCDKMEEARTCYQKAYDLNVQASSTYGQANALTHLGDTYRKLGYLEESCSHYQKSLSFHQEHHDQLGQANGLKALELHKAVSDLVGQANDISSLADIYRRSDDFVGAEEAYKQALDLHSQAKDDLGRGNALSHLGDLYRKQNKLSEAVSYYMEALQSHEKSFDKLGQANDLKGLGGIYHRQGDTSKAIDQYNAALSLYEATNSSLGKANCQRFIGRIYYTQHRLNDASEMFQNALENYKRANDSIGQGNALNDLGDIERRNGSLSRAEQLYKQALEAHEKANDKVGQGNDYKGLGIVYEKLYKLKDAKEMFEKAIDMHKQSGTTKSESKIKLIWKR